MAVDPRHAHQVEGEHCIYTTLPVLDDKNKSHTVPLETLKKMAIRENELRLGPSVQKWFRHYYGRTDPLAAAASKREDEASPEAAKALDAAAAAADDGVTPDKVYTDGGFTDRLDEMQRRVLEEFGYKRNDELVLYELRTAAMQYPDEPVFQESTFVKFNRCGDVALRAGSAAPEVGLYRFVGDVATTTVDASADETVVPPCLELTSLHAITKSFVAPNDPHAADGVNGRPLILVSGSYT